MSDPKNSWRLIGNLAADPEPRGAAARFRLAVETYNWKSKTRETEFFPIVAFGRKAEFVLKYMKKGSGAICEGKLDMNKWTDKAGQNRNDIQLVADEVEFPPSSKGAYGTAHAPDPGATIFDEDTSEDVSLI